MCNISYDKKLKGDYTRFTQENFDASQIISKTGSLSWNLVTNEVICSMNLLRLIGLKKNEVTVATNLDFIAKHIHPSERKKFKESFDTVLKNSAPLSFESKASKKEGEITPISVHVSGVSNKAGETIQIKGTLQDISQKKELEKIQKEKTKLEEQNKLNNLLISIISHDIRNPFNVLCGYSELIKNQVKNNNFGNVLKYNNIILEASNHTLQTFEEILAWYKIQSNESSLIPLKNNLKSIVDSIVLCSNKLFPKKNISITTNIEESLHVFADKTMVAAILRNLVCNAKRFSNENKNIEVSAIKTINEVIISVSDKGIGMDPDLLKNLFSLDKRISTYGTHREKGSGFGLHICKTLVEKQKGKIWIESKLGKGTTCYFTLPNSL